VTSLQECKVFTEAASSGRANPRPSDSFVTSPSQIHVHALFQEQDNESRMHSGVHSANNVTLQAHKRPASL
jgi:hypothetical protein